MFLPLLPKSCVLVMTLGLWGFCASSVHAALTEEEEMELIRAINFCRSSVSPMAADMRRMTWSSELARMAQRFSEKCTYTSNYERHTENTSFSYPYVGETIALSPEPRPNLTALVMTWNSQSAYYNFEMNKCYSLYPSSGCRCMNYLQMIQAGATHVGCGAHRCSKIHGYGHPNTLILVCNYGPGMMYRISGDQTLSQRPYQRAQASLTCASCPFEMPTCVQNLCSAEQAFEMGLDPHFIVLLPGGEKLCYSVQGQPGKIFSLFKNEIVQVNAQYVPAHGHHHETYLGAVGITCFKGASITIVFTAINHMITISSGLEIDARQIVEIIFKDNDVILTEADDEARKAHRHHRIHVEVTDLKLAFSVWIRDSTYLDVTWHSPGHLNQNSQGLIGQFFRDGVEIDAEMRVLHLPGQRQVPVVQRPMWKLHGRLPGNESVCWGARHRSRQGIGLIHGSYRDYEVDSLIPPRTRL